MFLILFALQKVAVSPHPGECLAAAVRTPWNHIRRNGRFLSHGGYHFLHRLHGIPGVVCAAGGTLEKAVIALNFRYLVLRVELDELGVLVGGENKEILSLQQRVQVEIGLTYRGGLGGVQEGGKVSPESCPVIPLAEHSIKSPLEVVLLCKFAEVFAEGSVVLVVEIPASGSGQAGGSTHYNAVGGFDLLYQALNLFLIRYRPFI